MALGRGPNMGQQIVNAMGGSGATSNSVLQMSMDALLGNMPGSGARPETRLPSWSDAGQAGQTAAGSTIAQAAGGSTGTGAVHVASRLSYLLTRRCQLAKAAGMNQRACVVCMSRSAMWTGMCL